MDKKEAIYLLRNTAWLAPSLEQVEEAVDMATEALKAGTEMSLPKWIPCSEKLPEDDGYYLVSLGGGDIEVEWYDKTGWGYFDVIAWMPLPDPWKGESE